MDILDILLLPVKTYKKLTAKKPSLFLGIILVGILDMVFPIAEKFHKLFSGKSVMMFYYNITLAAAFILLIGFVDVLFFTIPVFDVLRLFRKRKEIPHNEESLIKVMKVYVYGNLLILPINFLLFMGLDKLNFASGFMTELVASCLMLLPSAWLSAAVARGINAVFDFQPLYKRFIFPIVFAWSSILSITLSLIVQNWLMGLFK